MEHLFTPWRMAYVVSAKQAGCVFCNMLDAQDDRTMLILHRGQQAFLVLNKYPYNNGHLMAVPYRHVATLEDLAPEEIAEVMSLTTWGMGALRQILAPEGFNIGANVGQAAGAGVKNHFHMHIVPRWNGDTNYVSVLGGTRIIPQTLEETFDQLHTVLNAQPHPH